jgi:hypothetical protein
MMAVDDERRQLDRIAIKKQGQRHKLTCGLSDSVFELGSGFIYGTDETFTEISRADDIPANYQRNWHPHRPRHPPHQDWINC